MMKKKNITILGATGSIGLSTLDVIAQYSDQFKVFALTGYTQTSVLLKLCKRFHPEYVVLADNESNAQQLQQELICHGCNTQVLFGGDALCWVSAHESVDMVMAAIVGAAGLKPALAAAKCGKTILLANKETLVMAGSLFMEEAERNNAKIFPVDSEHNAIFQVLPKNEQDQIQQKSVESIILTASGGPFLQTDLDCFVAITPQMAVKHPKWSMGQKISVDSATMMNKGLEVIEAYWLFQQAKIEVVIHPQSIVHSMVRFIDGSILAQMGVPDMRIPISYCLGYPDRLVNHAEKLDFLKIGNLNFIEVDTQRFPCLQLAFDALHSSADAACVLNAANEVAVSAFLKGQIKFTDIAKIVANCLDENKPITYLDIENLIMKDRETRIYATEFVAKCHKLQ